ncbi:Uma2 family endonuclease [Paenibacillus sp. TRM 82003]|nr:Uma2 family endonuclease [Paenibacillus sp. TRM 82003]
MEYWRRSAPPPAVKEGGWTVDEYYRLPEDGNQYELYDGVLELKPSPTTTRQRISGNIEWILKDSCRNDYIIMDAPIDVVLSERETRQPDIVMIHRSREEIIEERGIVGPPDLIIEILSPSTAKTDRTRKKESYARFGVEEYWIVDPLNLTVEQYRLDLGTPTYRLLNVFDRNDTLRSDKLPCVSFAVVDALTLT